MMRLFWQLVFPITLLMGACNSNDDSGRQPTIFEGTVLYLDNDEPVSEGSINILGVEVTSGVGRPDETIFEESYPLDANGSFDLSFGPRSGIDYYLLRVFIGTNNFLSIECKPISCGSFNPGETYTDIVISAERE